MEKKIAWFHNEFSVKFENKNRSPVEISSDFWEHNYEFRRNNKLIAKVHKHWFSWTNVYDVTIEPEEDVILIFSCCAVIDRLSDKSGSSSSSSSRSKSSNGKG